MIYDVLNQIHKAQELLTDLTQRIEKDMEYSKISLFPTGLYTLDTALRSSQADIERVCKMARSYLKDCYGESNNQTYEQEIIEIKRRAK